MVIKNSEILLEFKRSSGPGGQNVNKVSTAVVLKFHIDTSQSISSDVKERLKRIAARKINNDGYLVLTSQIHRTQEKNRIEVNKKFRALLAKASILPKSRKFDNLKKFDKLKRLDTKKIRSEVKKNRAKVKY